MNKRQLLFSTQRCLIHNQVTTLLDVAYNNFNDNAKEDIIKLLKQHGGKAYKHLEDGTYYDGKT